MLESISTTQYQELKEYARIEPFGYELENFRTAIIAVLLNNANFEDKKELKDFYPKLTTKKFEPQSVEDQIAIAQMYCIAYSQKGG
jgi:hypothetical protein